ncbi:MAG: DUF6232 family protein [Granulosicoccus sp.]
MDRGVAGTDEVLYKDEEAQVSRIWLTSEATSYAIRSLTRVTFKEDKSPPIPSLLLFFFCLSIVFICCVYLYRNVVPPISAWLLIIISVVFWLGSIWYAFLKKPTYLIEAAFLDGAVVRIIRRKAHQGRGLHEAIRKAMRLHRVHDSHHDQFAPEPEHKPGEWSPAELAEQAASVQNARKRRRLRDFIATLSRGRN